MLDSGPDAQTPRQEGHVPLSPTIRAPLEAALGVEVA